MNTPTSSSAADIEDPSELAGLSAEALFSFTHEEIERFQLAGIQQRFAELRPKLPPLDMLAEDNRIETINTIDEVVPLLFPHTEYKSYPLSLIDNGRFAQLNEWLDGYTTHDLTHLDLTGCESLDDWLTIVEDQTPVRVVSSSGTSGKISLLPRSTVEDPFVLRQFALVYSKFGDERGLDDAYADDVYHVLVTPRKGRVNMCRSAHIRLMLGFGGDQSHVLTLDGELSSDVLWMTGRLKKAQADGTVEQLKTTKGWQRLNAKLGSIQTSTAADREAFFRDILVRLKGKTVAMTSGYVFYWELLETARKYGLEIAFGEGSCLFTAGGAKGKGNLTPEQLAEVDKAFPGLQDVYGASEMMGLARQCPQGHYHMPPSVVSFVLNPETGAPYPRRGVQTGRYATFDLWAQTFWAGIITGDEVTMNWDGGCGCGRKGPYLLGEIGRFADKQGGDDKITCQRSAAAVEEMMESLSNPS